MSQSGQIFAWFKKLKKLFVKYLKKNFNEKPNQKFLFGGTTQFFCSYSFVFSLYKKLYFKNFKAFTSLWKIYFVRRSFIPQKRINPEEKFNHFLASKSIFVSNHNYGLFMIRESLIKLSICLNLKQTSADKKSGKQKLPPMSFISRI